MVVSLLTAPPVGTPRPPAAHHFAYPTVRPLPRPGSTRRAEARTW
ncbi:MAG TPA: hypothetical protein VFT50_07900 [Baekduia sp.]|nr:hypothetical protein [Baekduia sp.]